MASLQLFGRVFITSTIRALTGLHIGGSGGSFSIGGNDNPVIIDAITGEPYIPGSSLRGKMRSLTEKHLGVQLVKHAGVDHMHSPDSPAEYAQSPIANIYGVPANDFNLPTRLIVRDVALVPASRDHLRAAKTDMPYTEIKTEVSIDRITSKANPRSFERVPAGAEFGPSELIYSVYTLKDIDWLDVLVDGMSLLEDDYLGGSGSRGSGRIEFRDITVMVKRSADYRMPQSFETLAKLSDLSAALPGMKDQIREYMQLNGRA